MLLRTGFLVLGLCLAFPAYADTSPAAASPASSAPESAAPAPSKATTSTEEAAAQAAPPTTLKLEPENLKSSDYILPTWADLLHTMIRFNAIDLEDNNLLDEYAAVTDCDIYGYFYKDDFKWNAIRKKVRESAELNVSKYPVHFYFFAILQLDHYDFDKKLYRFTPATVVHNVNVFSLFQANTPMCVGKKPDYIPKIFQAVSDVTFNSAGLPLSQTDAQSLFRQMSADKNVDHTVTARFNMTVTYIDRLRKTLDHGKKAIYFQSIDKPPPIGTLRIYTHLNSVEFYEDVAMTKLVYSFKP